MDLTRARATAARLADQVLTDTVVITVDDEAVSDDVLDEATGQLARPPGDNRTIYTGPGLVSPAATGENRPDQVGGASVYDSAYRLRIPAAAPTIPPGAVVAVTASLDAQLVNRAFTVLAARDGGQSITHRLTLEARARGPRR